MLPLDPESTVDGDGQAESMILADGPMVADTPIIPDGPTVSAGPSKMPTKATKCKRKCSISNPCSYIQEQLNQTLEKATALPTTRSAALNVLDLNLMQNVMDDGKSFAILDTNNYKNFLTSINLFLFNNDIGKLM